MYVGYWYKKESLKHIIEENNVEQCSLLLLTETKVY